MKYHLIEVCINTYELKRILKFNAAEYKNIRCKENYTYLWIDKNYWNEFKERCQKSQIEIVSEKEIGFINKIKKIQYIRVFGVTVCLFVAILLVISQFVWNISFDGNYTHTDAELKNFITENNINTGIFKAKIDCDNIEKLIRNNFSDITWVCAEVKGTNLIIHLNENYNKIIVKKEDAPYNIVANCDAVIDSIITRSGAANVKSGDQVKKGDLLISGAVDVYNEFEELISSKYVKADGDIEAEVNYNYSKKYDSKGKKKEYKKSYYTFNIVVGNKTFFTDSKQKEADVITQSYKMKIFKNFYLPVSIMKKQKIPFKYKDIQYSKEELKSLANKDFKYYLMTLEQKGYKILENNVKINFIGDQCVMEGDVKVLQPFGILETINVVEEGTTVNERN